MVSVWLPHLPIERLRREIARTGTAPPADRPFALVGSDTHGLSLTAVNAPCLKDGIAPGMRLADARAICPHLLTAPAAPDKDADALLALARWSARYSPTLNVDGEDGLWLDITGIAHLFGGETALLADLAKRLARAGLSARLGAAETLGAAHALARFAPPSPYSAPEGTLRAALAPLPVDALRLERETARLLRRLGLKRLGQLYDLPRASLERRFHAKETAQAVLRRLDQALGTRQEKRTPLLPAPDFAARLSFAEPLITHDGVAAGLDRLADALCATLTRAGQGARRVTLWAARTDGSAAAIEAGLSAPSNNASHLVRLLKDRLEAIDMGFGVDLMTLAALLTEPLRAAQTSLTETGRAPGPDALIDALTNRLGKRTVRRLFPQASHIPELAQSTRSAFAGCPAWTEAPEKPPRPPLLLATPEPLAVMAEIPEGPPARFTWRRVSRRVVKAEGPERIAPEWWRTLKPKINAKTKARPRDYYRIEDEDGCRYWVFREGLYQESDAEAPGWFLHGVFG
ncbi:MAG TPA: DNA polymerase Y family protein [Methyloceanibacter sp.]|nr:DNA polymerase Y family protein [Methyloceanibacter sp.]